MSGRIWFTKGAHGLGAEAFQRLLCDAGATITPDGDFGAKTEAATRVVQRAKGLPETGVADVATWMALAGTPGPGLFLRCLGLTAGFEGHGWSIVRGNFDGAGITWGCVGFTLKSGSLEAVFKNVARADLNATFQPGGADRLLNALRLTVPERLAFARDLTAPDGVNLYEPWKTRFEKLGTYPSARHAQLLVAESWYWKPALENARALGLTSERGVALCFDCEVQSGGVFSSAQKACREALRAGATEEAALLVLATQQAAALKEDTYRADVRNRKTTVAVGYGTVHGRYYALDACGLTMDPATLYGLDKVV